MFKNHSIYIYLLLFLALASCTRPNQYYARERYIVTSNNLNIRIDPTQLSVTIGTLTKGDTIIALASDKYWIMVKVNDQTGFVSNEYLKKLSPISAPKLIKFIEQNADWGKWQFWGIAIALVSLWILTELGLLRYENQLKHIGVTSKNISIAPLVFFVSGILTAVLYLTWKDQVIDSLFYNFTILPRGMGNMVWIIWIQALAILIAMAIDLIGSLYKSGFKYGLIVFSLEQLTNLTIFLTAYFLTIALYVAAIVFLVIFFTMLYITIVSLNSRNVSGFLSGKMKR